MRELLIAVLSGLVLACSSDAPTPVTPGTGGSSGMGTGGSGDAGTGGGGAGASGTGAAPASGGAGATAGSGGTSDPGAPRILSAGTNVTRLAPGETVVISVVVTDPDGVDDVVGGTLKSVSKGATFGAFATSGQEGAYSLSLTWEQLLQVELSTFDDELAVDLLAEFFDQAGHSATQSFQLTVHDNGGHVCEGVRGAAADPQGLYASDDGCPYFACNRNSNYCDAFDSETNGLQCVQTSYEDGLGVCAKYCTTDADCRPHPDVMGTAPPVCRNSRCMLDCAAGQVCPFGMVCRSYTVETSAYSFVCGSVPGSGGT